MKRTDAEYNENGRFRSGNPLSGLRGARVDASWLNAVQDELVNAITASGVDLDPDDDTQLAQAIVTQANAQVAAVALTPEMFGARRDPDGDDAKAITDCFAAAAERGVPAMLNGTYHIRTTIKGASNLRVITGTAKVVAHAKMQSALDLTGAMNLTIDPIDIEGHGLCADLIRGFGNRNLTLRLGRLTGWKNGLRLQSRPGAPLTGLRLEGGHITEPGPIAIYPVLIGTPSRAALTGDWARNVVVTGMRLTGSGGAYSATNSATADQLVFNGVIGGEILGVLSEYGGENGITVSRGSRDIRISGTTCSLNDGHGLNIGSAWAHCEIRGAIPPKGTSVIGDQSGTKAIVETVGVGRVIFRRVIGGVFITGETLNNGQMTLVSRLPSAAGIDVSGGQYVNNGVDVDGKWSGRLSGIYCQQSENVTLATRVTDTRASGQKTQDVGVLANFTEGLAVLGGVSGNKGRALRLNRWTRDRARTIIDDEAGLISLGGATKTAVLDGSIKPPTEDPKQRGVLWNDEGTPRFSEG